MESGTTTCSNKAELQASRLSKCSPLFALNAPLMRSSMKILSHLEPKPIEWPPQSAGGQLNVAGYPGFNMSREASSRKRRDKSAGRSPATRRSTYEHIFAWASQDIDHQSQPHQLLINPSQNSAPTSQPFSRSPFPPTIRATASA